MPTASRAFFLVSIFLALLSFAAVTHAQEEDTDANEACPSVPGVYVYISGVKYLDKVDGKVNLYGRKCVDYESGDKAAEGICTGPKTCKARLCDGKRCALPKLKVEDIKKAVYEGVSAPTTQAPLVPSDSLFKEVISPQPLTDQKPALSPSANSFGELLKQSESQPSGFVDKVRESVSNFFFPQRSINDVVPLTGGDLPGVEPKNIQTTKEVGITPGVTGFGEQQTSAPLETERFTGGEQASSPQEPVVPRIEQLARKVESLADTEPLRRLADADRELRRAREAVDASAETIFAQQQAERGRVAASFGGRVNPETGLMEFGRELSKQDIERINTALQAASATDPTVARSQTATNEYNAALEAAKPTLAEYQQAVTEYKSEYERLQLTQRQYIDSLEAPQDMKAAELRAEAEKAQALANAFRKTQGEVAASATWGLGLGLHCYGGIVCQRVTVNGETMSLSTYNDQAKSLIYESEARAAKLTRLADFFSSSDPLAEKISQTPLQDGRAELVLKHVDDMLEARSQIVPYDPAQSPEQPPDDRPQRIATEKQATIERLISGDELTAAERSVIYPSTMPTKAIDLDAQRQRLMDSNLAHAPVVGRVVTSLYDAMRLTGDPTAQQLRQMASMTETQLNEQKFDAWRSFGVSSALSAGEAYLFFTPGGLALTGTALKTVTPEFVVNGIEQGVGAVGKGFAYVAPETAGVFRGWAASGGIVGDLVDYSVFRGATEFKPTFASELDAFGTRVASPYIEQEQKYFAESVAKGVAPDVAEATAYRNLYTNIAGTDIVGSTRVGDVLTALEKEMATKNIALPVTERTGASIAGVEPTGQLSTNRSLVPYEGPPVASGELPAAPVLPRTASPSIVPPAEPSVPAVTTPTFAPTTEQMNNLTRELVVAKTPPVVAEVDVVRAYNNALETNAAAQAAVREGKYAADAPIARAARDDLLAATRGLEDAGLFTRLAPLDAQGVVPFDRIYRAGTGEIIAERVAPIAYEEPYQLLGQEIENLAGAFPATPPVAPAAPPALPSAVPTRASALPTQQPVFQATPAFAPLPQQPTAAVLLAERPAFNTPLTEMLAPGKAPLAPELTAAEKRIIEKYGSTDGALRNLRIQGVSPTPALLSEIERARAGLTSGGLRISDITGAIYKGDAIVAVQKPVVFPGESPYQIVAPVKEIPEATLAQASAKASVPDVAPARPTSLWQSLSSAPTLARAAIVSVLSFNPALGEFVGTIIPALAERPQIVALAPANKAGTTAVVPAASPPAVQALQPQGKTVASIFGTPGDKKKGDNVMASGQRIDYTHSKGLYVVAHRTLPLGTKVVIRNPANGKTVVAQVGERGPYVKGRDLDLFEVVAKGLGFTVGGKGTAPVEWAVIANSAKGVTPFKLGRTDLGDLSKNGPLGTTADIQDAGGKYAAAYAPDRFVAANPAPPRPQTPQATAPAAATSIPAPSTVKTELAALQENAVGARTKFDVVAKNITAVQASVNALHGAQTNIAAAVARVRKTEDTMQTLTYTSQAVSAGARLVGPIEHIARSAGDTQLLKNAHILARERSAVASRVSEALQTYEATHSRIALIPYISLQERVPALLDKGNALIARAQKVADVHIASLHEEKAALSAQLKTAEQKLAEAQKAPTFAGTPNIPAPAANASPPPPEEVVAAANANSVMKVADDMNGGWPGFVESEPSTPPSVAPVPTPAPVPALAPARIVSVAASPYAPYTPTVTQYTLAANAPSAPLPIMQARFNAARKPDEPTIAAGTGGARPETSTIPEPTVYILSGGTSAGKTTVAKNILAELNSRAPVFDDAIQNAGDITRVIDEALAAEKVPNVVYVYRDPIEAFGANRSISIDSFANSYIDSQRAVKGLLENQALREQGLQITLIDNSRGLGNAAPMTPEEFNVLTRPSLADLKQQLLAKTNELFDAGLINPQEYRTIAGVEPPAKAPSGPIEAAWVGPEVEGQLGWLRGLYDGAVERFAGIGTKIREAIPPAPEPAYQPPLPAPEPKPVNVVAPPQQIAETAPAARPSSPPVYKDQLAATLDEGINSAAWTGRGQFPYMVGTTASVPKAVPAAALKLPQGYADWYAQGALSDIAPARVAAEPKIVESMQPLLPQQRVTPPTPDPVVPQGYADWYAQGALTDTLPTRSLAKPKIVESMQPLIPRQRITSQTPAPVVEPQQLQLPFGAQQMRLPLDEPVQPPRSAPTPREPQQLNLPLDEDQQLQLPFNNPNAVPAIATLGSRISNAFSAMGTRIRNLFGGRTAAPASSAPAPVSAPIATPVAPAPAGTVPTAARPTSGTPTLVLKVLRGTVLPGDVSLLPPFGIVRNTVLNGASYWLAGPASPLVNAGYRFAVNKAYRADVFELVARIRGTTPTPAPTTPVSGVATPTPTPTPLPGGGTGGAGGGGGGIPPGGTPTQPNPANPQPGAGQQQTAAQQTANQGWFRKNWVKLTGTTGVGLFAAWSVSKWFPDDGSGGGGGSDPNKNKNNNADKPPVVKKDKPDRRDEVTPPPRVGNEGKACGPNETYASSGCYPPYVPPGARTNIPPSGDYRSKNPQSSFGSVLGQLLGRLFGTTPPTSAPTTPPQTPPVIPPTPTSTPAKPYATLIANPSSVPPDGKARLIWASVNTSSCELFAPDAYLMATGTRGSTSTLPLSTTTAFALNCQAPSGATTTASTTVTVR